MSIEQKRKQHEINRVRLAREELELKIEDRLIEIARLKEHIEVQLSTELKLEQELKNLKGE